VVSPPQVRRDLAEIENHLRLTRNRLTCYELLDDTELAAHTRRVVTGLEETKEVLLTRIQSFSHVENHR
jgi:hypothetical protein